jgi:hemerythrin
MPLFTWNATYELGLPAMDRQHQLLVQAINDLHEAMQSGKDRDAVIATILQLISYTKVHFESEEQFLTSKGYPEFPDHRMEHHAFVKRVLDFHNAYLDGRVVLSAEVMQFLKDWLASHILINDRKYATWMKQRGLTGIADE